MSQKPGTRNFPWPSITRASRGIVEPRDGPTLTIRVPRTTTVWSRRGPGALASTTATCVIATLGCADAGSASPAPRVTIAAIRQNRWVHGIAGNMAHAGTIDEGSGRFALLDLRHRHQPVGDCNRIVRSNDAEDLAQRTRPSLGEG